MPSSELKRVESLACEEADPIAQELHFPGEYRLRDRCDVLSKRANSEPLASWIRYGLNLNELRATLSNWRPVPDTPPGQMTSADLLCYVLLGIPKVGIADIHDQIVDTYTDINNWVCCPLHAQAEPIAKWVHPCASALQSRHAEVRRWGTFLLGSVKSLEESTAAGLIQVATTDPDETLRLAAAEAFVKAGHKAGIIVMVLGQIALDHPNESMRERALSAICAMMGVLDPWSVYAFAALKSYVEKNKQETSSNTAVDEGAE